ncbi:hypothetical protein A0H81_05025 [Grifola frondosa]|uniref:Uncharacterized protein n=1 Tax=Grifola frondosa TaxID=5627 RepID=A0A1C7MDT1_GRIFR|nr:hypothetical protein A0H81_05025 [Grifola frondosa]
MRVFDERDLSVEIPPPRVAREICIKSLAIYLLTAGSADVICMSSCVPSDSSQPQPQQTPRTSLQIDQWHTTSTIHILDAIDLHFRSMECDHAHLLYASGGLIEVKFPLAEATAFPNPTLFGGNLVGISYAGTPLALPTSVTVALLLPLRLPQAQGFE